MAATRAKHRLTLVSSFASSDVDPDRLTKAGARLQDAYQRAVAAAEPATAEPAAQEPAAAEPQPAGADSAGAPRAPGTALSRSTPSQLDRPGSG